MMFTRYAYRLWFPHYLVKRGNDKCHLEATMVFLKRTLSKNEGKDWKALSISKNHYFELRRHVYLYVMCALFCNFRVAGHPLAQNERCLHMFLHEPVIDKNYVPGKIRTTS